MIGTAAATGQCSMDPMAEQRARDYFEALKAGRLKVLREIE
jgi:hypothetical protein